MLASKHIDVCSSMYTGGRYTFMCVCVERTALNCLQQRLSRGIMYQAIPRSKATESYADSSLSCHSVFWNMGQLLTTVKSGLASCGSCRIRVHAVVNASADPLKPQVVSTFLSSLHGDGLAFATPPLFRGFPANGAFRRSPHRP